MNYALIKVSTLQTDIKWADPIANQQAVESALLASAPADLYVLPEMWDTGFMASESLKAEEKQLSTVNYQLSILN